MQCHMSVQVIGGMFVATSSRLKSIFLNKLDFIVSDLYNNSLNTQWECPVEYTLCLRARMKRKNYDGVWLEKWQIYIER